MLNLIPRSFSFGLCFDENMRQCLTSQIVNDEPRLAAVLLVLGSFTLARFIFQTLSVLVQTFVLPGQNVRYLTFQISH